MPHTELIGTDGPLLVFLPGITGTTRYWRGRVAHLATANRLLLVDPLGFGRSPRPEVGYDMESHVAALHQVLSGRGPFTLVGHSFGAMTAVAYAARHPEQVERLAAPLAGVQALAAGRPSWEVRVRPGVGHHPLLEAPEWALAPLTPSPAPAAAGGN